MFQSIEEFPNNLAYSLRFPAEVRIRRGKLNWMTDSLFEDHYYETRHPNEQSGGFPSYFQEEFLTIQNAIANAFMFMTHTMNMTIPKIQMQRFPLKSSTYHKFANLLFLPLIFLLSLNFTFVNMIRFITIEKEKQLKEAMKVMGLANWMHYFSWFIRSLAMLLIPMLLITMCLKVNYSIFRNK